MIADVEFVYVVSRDRALADGGQEFPGPQFDLPLKKLKWRFYLPESYDYDELRGTLTVNEKVLRQGGLRRYTGYERYRGYFPRARSKSPKVIGLAPRP